MRLFVRGADVVAAIASRDGDFVAHQLKLMLASTQLMLLLSEGKRRPIYKQMTPVSRETTTETIDDCAKVISARHIVIFCPLLSVARIRLH